MAQVISETALDDLARPNGKRNGRRSSQELLTRLRLHEEPMRAEVLSLDQLHRHGQLLANWHRVASRQRKDRLLARLEENERVLQETRAMLSRSAAEGRAIPPAGEWLLDNYYLIQSQIRLARQHLPRRYSMELPQLEGGPGDGLPRVYDIALELISHVDGLIDTENVDRFAAAYQSVRPLRIGELWAIPIMLRLSLIENLRRVALRVAWQHNDRRLGEVWAERILRAADESFGRLIHVVSELVDHEPPITSGFVSRFTQLLQGRLPSGNVVTAWLEQHLSRQGQTVEQLINADSQAMAADQVSMGNSVTSLRALEALDWKEFVERQSVVERALRRDPAGVHPAMAFASRDKYRHVIEKIAKRSALTEEQVARLAVEHAEAAAAAESTLPDRRPTGREAKRTHVGYYLLDKGRPQLEESAGYRATWFDRLARPVARAPLAGYLGAVLLIEGTLLGAFVATAAWIGLVGATGLVGFAILLALLTFAGTQPAVAFVNWAVTLFVEPRPVMRLDFSKGIDREFRTLVVVPTMLTSAKGVRSLVEALEVRYLANRDPNLSFALLTDFTDADSETLPIDAALLEMAKAEIDRLNEEYRGDRPSIFHLLHRPRKWNPQEGVWMGEERKRGKLADFNRLVRTGATDAFSFTVGDVAQLAAARFVITLDTDTQLPNGAAAELVGCLAHPLNRPWLDPATGMVVEGHAILQPRVGTTVPEANKTPYSRLYAGDAGIDPYTRQTSDLYQDVFGEGSFIGKGIYDVHAFESSLQHRFGANRVLSHDLIEGCYARSGLVNDVELFEGFPSTLLADMSRRHRWIRGDWQIAAWLRRSVPTARRRERNTLTPLSRWKVFDNLRRSLVPLAVLLFLALGWSLAPAQAWLVTLFALAVPFGPALVCPLPGLIRKPKETPWRLHGRTWFRNFVNGLAREGIDFAILPYVVHCNIDAIARTLYRLNVSRRRLLEWTTASDAEKRSKGGIRNHYELMAANTLAGFGLAAALAIHNVFALAAALPVLVTWLLGPLVAWRVSQPRRPAELDLSQDETRQLRRLSRHTWHYFETYVAEQDNWLPPDNVREHPEETIAARTSPTNIGLGLLASLAARDFGYLPAGTLLDRTARTFATLRRLPRFRGHFYNWYETRTLAVISPRYVSSVDSGNLWGHLAVLRSGLLEQADQPVVAPRITEGLQDALFVLQSLVDRAAREQPGDVRWREAVARLDRIAAECDSDLGGSARRTLGFLLRVEPMLEEFAEALPAEPAALGRFAEAARRQCRAFHEELTDLAFWVRPLPELRQGDAAPVAHRELIGRLTAFCDRLDTRCRLRDLPTAAQDFIELVRSLPPAALFDARVTPLTAAAERAAERAGELLRAAAGLAADCEAFSAMDFRFLVHPERKIIAVGYNETERRRDNSFYDLIASESRLTSYMAVSRGQLPADHWFALGRIMTAEDGEPTLLSWSGSMFEYLMPMLVMPSYEGTILDESCHAAVRRQIRYGRRRGVPWGVSESCYNVVDGQMNYQYRAFGVPGLGLQRGLGEHLVIAPYASAMAVPLAPHAACDNLAELERRGYLGDHGFYDAIDYTAGRRLPDGRPAPCRTVMAHHSGMTLLAFAMTLLGRPMQRRFLADPLCRAHDLLLQERVPHAIRPVDMASLEVSAFPNEEAPADRPNLRVFDNTRTPAPEVHLLSNGRYHVALTNAGGGRSCWNELAVSRWRADFAADAYGQFCYVRDLETGDFWSNTFQPTRRDADRYQAVFSQGRVEYRVARSEVDVRSQIAVSPEDDVEVRRVIATCLSRLPRRLEFTSYAEVVLAPQDSDLAHRTFFGLFVETEWLPDRQALLCRRRPRSADENCPYLFHLLHVHGDADRDAAEPISFETSRDSFLGRTRSATNPIALDPGVELSGSVGPVLDPIVSLRRRLTLAPEEAVTIDFVTGVAETREKALALVEKYQDARLADRVFELSRSHSQVTLEHLGITEADAQLYAQIASSLLYPTPRPGTAARGLGRQDQLWTFGVGGDLPIVLARLSGEAAIGLATHLIKAHAYWRGKGVKADLVFRLEDESVYRSDLHDRVLGLLISMPSGQWLDQPGGVFVRRDDQFTDDDWQRLEAAASLVVSDIAGTLEEQTRRLPPPAPPTALLKPNKPAAGARVPARRPTPDLVQFNGTGGFTRDGREYITLLAPGAPTPAPWCNVLANPQFGAVVSESGLGYTWLENAHEFRLTPWSNDPVSDPPGEAIYIRDDETGEAFSATPLPAPGGQTYLCRHGFGYTVWETAGLELETELWVYVSVESPAKFFLLTIRNTSGRKRKLSVAAFAEWVLGEHRDKTARHLLTEVEPQSGALLAQNRFHIDLHDRVAFLQSSEKARSVTCDRTEFLGRCGSPDSPEALRRANLSGRAGFGSDSAAAMLCRLDLTETEAREVAFVLGADRPARARELAGRSGTVTAARHELHRVWEQWNRILGAVHVETPHETLDLLTNGWLPYQTLAARFWGRSGFYQSGGAYGFRDQLQDSLALLHFAAHLTREHLLACAARQFEEGDVQHWWHPPTGRGVRTRCSDDLLWLPYVAARYVEHTGDTGVLDEPVHFLRDRELEPNEESVYSLAETSEDAASLYDHCRLAIRRASRTGRHGLPLIGAGDWNDGMNRVGPAGRGESVWLGFFLVATLKDFEPIARDRGDLSFAEECLARAADLEAKLAEHAWDGEWFRRAFFDDGRPLGSAKNSECQIDSLPQAWATIARAAEPERLKTAMRSVFDRLVETDARLIRLFAPPFDQHPGESRHPDPGYVAAYPPGVRENGGQYTHAAVWTAMAFAQMGDAERAWECFGLLLPPRHASSPEEAARYRVEPYVMAADVYAEPPHAGRGGWTWYTGTAGWTYRLVLETLLGVTVHRGRLMRFQPCPHPSWKSYKVRYRHRETYYHIDFTIQGKPAHHVERVTLDGQPQRHHQIELVDDGREHRVEVTLGIA